MCKKTIVTCALAAFCLMAFAQEKHGRHQPNGGERPRRHAREGENGDRKMHGSSESGERRRPQINEETRKLIAAYRRDPTEAHKAALRLPDCGIVRSIAIELVAPYQLPLRSILCKHRHETCQQDHCYQMSLFHCLLVFDCYWLLDILIVLPGDRNKQGSPPTS